MQPNECEYSSDFFLLRIPLFPYQHLFNFFKIIQENPNGLSNELKKIYQDPLVQEALYIATPVLYKETLKYLNNEIFNKKKVAKIEASLIDYYRRMCSECTPFGLFGNFMPGVYGNTTDMFLAENNKVHRLIRFDMECLCAVASLLNKNPEFQKIISYYPNTSIKKIRNYFRIIETRESNAFRKYHVTDIESSAILNEILIGAYKGIAFNDICEIVIKYGYSNAEAEFYFTELISSQILVSEVNANVTGKNFFYRLIEYLNKHEPFNNINTVLNDVYTTLSKINSCADKIYQYQQAFMQFKKLNIPVNENRFIQVDSTRINSHITLENSIPEDILTGIKILSILDPFKNAYTKLHEFKKRFKERYGTRAVLLMEAIDSETGIGYDFKFPSEEGAGKSNLNYESLKIKLNLFKDHLKQNQDIVAINLNEIDGFSNTQLPNSFSAIVSIYSGIQENIIYIKKVYNPASTLLARFSAVNIELEEYVKDLCKKEEETDPELIFAEIIHLPQPRTGNILNRPQLRQYEIPYLAHTLLPYHQQVPVRDLWLKMINDKLVLFSKKLNKQIAPRLSSAHNFHINSLPVYNFLCDLQFQNTQPFVAWDWEILSNESYLPRIVHKNLILSPAIWNIKETDFRDIDLKEPDLTIKEKFCAIKLDLKIPNKVFFCEFGREQMLSLNDSFSINYFLKQLKKLKNITLKEVLLTTENPITRGADGFLNNEFVIPYVKKLRGDITASNDKISFKLTNNKAFETGFEWLFIKIYLSSNTLDKLMPGKFYPLLSRMIKDDIINQWFFIRYKDPGFHLRLRVKIKDKSLYYFVLSEIEKLITPFTRSGEIYDIKIEKYKREVERFGSGVELVEILFYIHSNTVCKILKVLSIADALQIRFFCCLLGIEYILNDFSYTQKDVLAFYREGYELYFDDKDVKSIQLKNEFSVLYRNEIIALRSFKDRLNDKNTLEWKIDNIFKNQSSILAAYFKDQDRDKKFRINSKKNKITFDIIHLFVNRFFKDDHRYEESKLYYYLSKYYRSLSKM